MLHLILRKNNARSANVTFCLSLACLVTAPRAVSAGELVQASAVTPTDVFARLVVVHAELETLRHYMGKKLNEQPDIRVRGAAPREVYFQALAMFHNAERLCFEHTRERIEDPNPPVGEITAGDVYCVVDATIARIRRVKEKVGVVQSIEVVDPGAEKSPTDVFCSVVQANRQLNLLLERQVAPSDVFQQVTLGVGYAARLLEQFPADATIPEQPEFEVGKRPEDVYRRLLTCLEHVRRIARRSGVDMLDLEADERQILEAEPSDVYHMASLLVSELAYLHSLLDHSELPEEAYYVGRKFPSHVHQRAGILERQLEALGYWVDQHPKWFAAGGTAQ